MPTLRGSIYYTRFRVPARLRDAVSAAEIWRSLGTDSLREAKALEPEVKAALLAELEARAGGTAKPAELARHLRAIAATRGFSYLPAAALAAEGRIEDLLTRMEATLDDAGRPDPVLARALLGGVEEVPVMLSGLLEYVVGLDATKEANKHKSKNQLRQWRNPRIRAIQNLRLALKAAGRPDDMPVAQITREIGGLHQNWWSSRIVKEKLSSDSAQREYSTMAGMLSAYWNSVAKPNPKAYSGVSNRTRFTKKKRKPEFSLEWIEASILALGALDGLNDEATDITIIAAETGCRQSEIYNTPEDDWHLDHPIPHFLVRYIEDPENGRDIKNVWSERRVPLVGAGLEAALRRKGRFPRYRGGSTYSDTVNKFLRGKQAEDGSYPNSRFPTPKHTIGGLRHSWETRMGDIGIDNEARAFMMGHSIEQVRGRAVYGDDEELQVRRLIARLVCVGVITDPDERLAAAEQLQTLMDRARARASR